MKFFTRSISIILSLMLLVGCGKNNTSANSGEDVPTDPVPIPQSVRVGSLKGPTSMGLVSMMDSNAAVTGKNFYEFTMVTAADELLGQMATGKLDIALLPANLAANLYQKMDGGLAVININTLGVLYIVTGSEEIRDLRDLSGRTLILTGKGTTPDYAVQYLLDAYDVKDVTLEYKSEAAEVAAVLAADPNTAGLLPQPFVTAAMMQNDQLQMVLDLSEEWDALDNHSRLVTGVTVVRRDFLESYPDAVSLFLEDHAASVAYTNEYPAEAAKLIAAAGIVAKAPIAQKALPYCHLTCLTGEEMRTALSGYLQVLHGQNPQSVGGALPEDDFYYIP